MLDFAGNMTNTLWVCEGTKGREGSVTAQVFVGNGNYSDAAQSVRDATSSVKENESQI